MSIDEKLRRDAEVLLIDNTPLFSGDIPDYIKYFKLIRDRIYQNIGITKDDMSYEKFYENFDFLNMYKDYLETVKNSAVFAKNGKGKTPAGARWLSKKFDETMNIITGSGNPYYISIANKFTKELRASIENIINLGIDVGREKRLDKLTLKNEKEKFKLQEKLGNTRNDIVLIEEEIGQLKKDRPAGYRGLIDELEKKKTDKLLLLNDINASISNIDKILLKEMQEKEKAQRVTAAERKRKYKIMTAESNKLAQEIQKTIQRVAAEGFGNGEYQYTGRGNKSKKSKKVKGVRAKPKGGKYYEDPREEVSYILKRLADLVEEGDLEHLDIIAKKLRKVKKIGRGKYYIMDEEEIEGGAVKTNTRANKKRRGGIVGVTDTPTKIIKSKIKGGRVMSAKQKAWMDLVDKVQAKHPNKTRKECMQLASEKRNKSK